MTYYSKPGSVAKLAGSMTKLWFSKCIECHDARMRRGLERVLNTCVHSMVSTRGNTVFHVFHIPDDSTRTRIVMYTSTLPPDGENLISESRNYSSNCQTILESLLISICLSQTTLIRMPDGSSIANPSSKLSLDLLECAFFSIATYEKPDSKEGLIGKCHDLNGKREHAPFGFSHRIVHVVLVFFSYDISLFYDILEYLHTRKQNLFWCLELELFCKL